MTTIRRIVLIAVVSVLALMITMALLTADPRFVGAAITACEVVGFAGRITQM